MARDERVAILEGVLGSGAVEIHAAHQNGKAQARALRFIDRKRNERRAQRSAADAEAGGVAVGNHADITAAFRTFRKELDRARRDGRNFERCAGAGGRGDDFAAGIGDHAELNGTAERGAEDSAQFEEPAFDGAHNDIGNHLPQAHARGLGVFDRDAVFVIGGQQGRAVFEDAFAGAHNVTAGFEFADAVDAAVIGLHLGEALDGFVRGVDVDGPVGDADAVFIEHRAGDCAEPAHADLDEVRLSVGSDFEGHAGTSGAQLPGFGGGEAFAGGAQDVPSGAHAEDGEGAAVAGADGDDACGRAGQRDQGDDGSGKGVAGFLVENDAFDDGGMRGDCEGERQEEGEEPGECGAHFMGSDAWGVWGVQECLRWVYFDRIWRESRFRLGSV